MADKPPTLNAQIECDPEVLTLDEREFSRRLDNTLRDLKLDLIQQWRELCEAHR